MEIKVVEGDLLAEDVEVIVNPWNRNIIPWWLLIPQGVSGLLKCRAGLQPFRELAAKGHIPLGGAVETGAGKLPFRAIIHVAGINIFWRSSEKTIRACVRNALLLARNAGYRSIAFPLIGSGTGGFSKTQALDIIQDEAARSAFTGEIRLVKYKSSMNERGCYCGIWEKDPSFFESRGVPRGYCGLCEKCGRPGHTRHFPGAAPYTGTWCDFHYRILSIIHPLGIWGVFAYAALALILLFVLRS
ncbi:MAG TPA: macro domain-containing protein [Elusimicrobiales bacterium]|nr:macro domain-containing protein [Elusimicrobiales bacterium]